MPGTPKINIITAPQSEGEEKQNVFLLPTKMDSSRKRSSSVTPSERSRITLVEEDADITSSEASEPPQGILEIRLGAPKIRWIEHVLGVFCIELPRRKKTEVIGETFIPHPKTDSTSLESPFIVSVFVLSRHVVQEHYIPKRAQCTIDTGNHQGNVVSRDFLVNELGYTEDGFLDLTDEEKKGGISATDTKLVPQGAVYLDWYHGRSVQVFRKMRFLVSPHSICDLIIGARSIEKNNILGVPILSLAARDTHGIKDNRTADEKQLTDGITKLKKKLTDQDKRFKAMPLGPPKDNLGKEMESNRRELLVLQKEHAYRNAKEGDKKNALKELEEAEAAQRGDPPTQVIPSSSKTTTTGTDVEATKP